MASLLIFMTACQDIRNVAVRFIHSFIHSGKAKLFEKKTIVYLGDDASIAKQLETVYHLKQNVNFFSEHDFFEKYLSVFAVYVADKVYFPSSCFICTTLCTLNCQYCLTFTPYDKNKRHANIEDLKKDVDLFFSCIDRIGLFHVSGGEPLLYPHFNELMTYIGESYRNQIEEFGMVTNVTIVPTDELCDTFKKYNVMVLVDDYTQSIPRLRKSLDEAVEKLKSYSVSVKVIVATDFIELFPPKQTMLDASDDVMRKKWHDCNQIFAELKNGKLYNCNWAEFAMQAGLFEETIDDYYDLREFDNSKKKELVEYRLRYCNKGYIDFCRYCNGNQNINVHKSKAAIQAKGLLQWDINNPTEAKGQ